MAFNFRLNVQNVFRRLGIQTGRLPQLNENIQMTLQLSDLSRLIPAPIEPRGLAAFDLAPTPGNFPVVQLQSRASGGIFVETIWIRGQAFPQNEGYWLNVKPAGAPFGGDLGLPLAIHTVLGTPFLQNLDIGGTPIASVWTAGNVAIPGFGVLIPVEAGVDLFQYDLGAFVPNQSFLTMSPSNLTRRLNVAIVYRELPSVEQI